MVSLQNLQSRFFLAWFALLFAFTSFFGPVGISEVCGAEVGCLPPTPSPCAADGICRPNQELFGYSQTRWRPWPGDPKPEEPTLAGDKDPATEQEMELAPFLRPTPEEEDTRGPAKTKSFTPSEENSPQALPEPEEDPFSDLDLQNSIPELYTGEDAPPELPQGLRNFASANRLAHHRTAQPSPDTQSDRFNPIASSNKTRQSLNLQSTEQPRRIVQVAAEQRVGLNSGRHASGPTASGTASKGNGQGNRRAIYYRTADRKVSGQTK